MGFETSDQAWNKESFLEYTASLGENTWAKGICFHHTFFPSLRMRPHGLTDQHQKNLLHYYKQQKKWSDGPHLFTDDHRILGMSGLGDSGVHSVGFNSTHIGIEVLGNYDVENPETGRGKTAWENAYHAAACLCLWMDIEPTAQTLVFHREDGYTRKTCPGTRVKKYNVIEGVKKALREISDPAPSEEILEPRPRIPNWTDYKIVNGGHYVPILPFLTHCGGDPSQICGDLKKDGDLLEYQGDVIEHAFYDRATETTYALASELLNFV